MNRFRKRADVVDSPARGTATMRARHVDVVRSGRSILNGVDLDVVSGEVLALVGPNGAGKSTLLAALAGELGTHAGEVELNGRPLREWTGAKAARRRAVLPQQHTVGFAFTAEQVVRMGRSPWQGTARADEDEDAVSSAMAECDVVQFRHRAFASLSGGERARVSLARVLAQRTSTLLLDEPTAALDIGHQEAVMAVAVDRARRNDAVVVVLHDLALAAAYADRIAIISNGSIEAVGLPNDVLNEDVLTRVYRHPVEVFAHPRTGNPVVLPVRNH